MKKFYESQVYGPVQSYWFEEISDFLVIGTIDFSYGTVRGYAFSYEFVNKNVLKLELKQLIGFHESILQPEIYIYKRKK
jgi:hypothetical protein